MRLEAARCARSRHRHEGAQAVLETALVIPVLMVMLAVFLGLMVQVQVQQEMDTATKLAVESVFQAQRCDGKPCIGTTYADDSFNGTMSFYDRYLEWPGTTAHVRCTGPYLGDPLPAPPSQEVQCTATAVLRFDRSPLAWAVVWNPTVSSLASAFPPPFRQ